MFSLQSNNRDYPSLRHNRLRARINEAVGRIPGRCLPLFGRTVLAIAGLLFVLNASVQADVVLLYSGAVIDGEVQDAGDRVLLRTENRELSLRKTDIRKQAASLSAIYRWQRSQLNQEIPDLGEHLHLAEWCLRNQLWPEASRELLDARQLAPRSQRVAMLERRLMLISAQQIADAKKTPSKRTFPVQTASHEEASRKGQKETPSNLQLNAEQLKHFTRRIQPLLVNNCTDGGCHRQEKTEQFGLDVMLRHGFGNRRSTEHNLQEVLAAINAMAPKESPLLTAAKGPHVGISPFVGPRREEWLNRLETWVVSVAESNAILSGTPLNDASQEIAATASPTQPAEFAVVQASAIEPIQAATQLATPLASETQSTELLADTSLNIGRPVRQAFQPRDEFDPEIFNRKYRRPTDDLPPEPTDR